MRAVLAIALLLLPRAAIAASDLEDARRLMRVPAYDDAIRALDRALSDRSLSREDRIEALEMLASAHIAQNDTARAEQAFRELLDLSPDHALSPAVSPKIRAVFDRVKKSRIRAPRIDAVTASVAADRIVFRAIIDDPDEQAVAVRLSVRSNGDFAEIPMIEENGAHTATVALGPGTARIEYFVAITDRSANVIELGSARNPSVILRATEPRDPTALAPPPPIVVSPDPPLDPEPNVLREWWFWTIVGVAIAGAGVGIYLGTRSSEPEPMGNLGDSIQLP